MLSIFLRECAITPWCSWTHHQWYKMELLGIFRSSCLHPNLPRGFACCLHDDVTQLKRTNQRSRRALNVNYHFLKHCYIFGTWKSFSTFNLVFISKTFTKYQLLFCSWTFSIKLTFESQFKRNQKCLVCLVCLLIYDI